MSNAQVFARDVTKGTPKRPCPSCLRQQSCDLLSDVPSGTELCAVALKRRYELRRGETLFRQHDPCSTVYLVRKGSLKTERITPEGQLVITGFQFPGDLLGLASLSATRHVAGGVALETSEVCEFDVERLLALCSTETVLNRWFIRHLGQELQEKDAALCWATRMKCCDRVLRFFVELHDWLSPSDPCPPEPLRMPMTKQDIAMYLHMSPETLSRTLGDLRNEGTLRVSGTTFVLTDIRQARQRTRL
jgi:CRP/FNR family transcriptional regulator